MDGQHLRLSFDFGNRPTSTDVARRGRMRFDALLPAKRTSTKDRGAQVGDCRIEQSLPGKIVA